MTFRPETGFTCDGCTLPISAPLGSLELSDGHARDLCDDCAVIIIDAIDHIASVLVVVSWADDPDWLDEPLDDDAELDRRRTA